MLHGQLLGGRYRVGRALSAGGMGRICSGVDEVTGAPVVVKVPQPAEGDCANCVRLEREARATERVESPHLIRFLAAGRRGRGMPFLVLERLEGVDLGTLVKENGALPVGLAVSYVRQACRGLAALHAAGLVHRDVKPSNLFLCTRGPEGPLVKVIDLGLAKGDDAPVTDPSLTGDHMLLGSPSYVSPEQMRQLELDGRTDVWSLGVVLFELVTGARPFQGHTIVDVCAQILTQPVPSVRERSPELDQALDAVIQRCLAKDRADRYASVLELAEALRPFEPARGAISTPVAPPQGKSAPARPEEQAAPGLSRLVPTLERWRLALAALLCVVIAALWTATPRWSVPAEPERACARASGVRPMHEWLCSPRVVNTRQGATRTTALPSTT